MSLHSKYQHRALAPAQVAVRDDGMGFDALSRSPMFSAEVLMKDNVAEW